MRNHSFALLVHSRCEPFQSLKQSLRDLSIETYSVATCREAEELISQCKPHIVFTDASLVDGSWERILNFTDTRNVPLSLIVVSAVVDTRLYLSVMERGAFDFVVPPFEHESLNFVTRSAALATQRRREALASAAAGWQPLPLSRTLLVAPGGGANGRERVNR